MISGKLIHWHSKGAALEDTMNILKKAFEKGLIPVDQYLRKIRDLANKQFKTVYKSQKLTGGPKQAQPQQMMQPGMM
jgi:3-oxoacyl-(acyl-carrier-protein) synthase